jgi:hypothetical protein
MNSTVEPVWSQIDTVHIILLIFVGRHVPLRVLFCLMCHMGKLSVNGIITLKIQRSRVLFPALKIFLRSSGSGMGSTQPREDNWGTTWRKSSGSGVENRD